MLFRASKLAVDVGAVCLQGQLDKMAAGGGQHAQKAGMLSKILSALPCFSSPQVRYFQNTENNNETYMYIKKWMETLWRVLSHMHVRLSLRTCAGCTCHCCRVASVRSCVGAADATVHHILPTWRQGTCM